MTSLPELLRSSARQYPNHNAIIQDGVKLTFAEFDRQSDCVAAGLIERGIKKSDRVALYTINSAEFAIAYVGILKASATVVPVNLLQNPMEMEFVLQDAGAIAIIYNGLFESTVSGLMANLDCIKLAVSIDPQPDCTVSWVDLISNSGQPGVVDIDSEVELAVILYTSGTTGRPKGAMLSHSNLVSNVRSAGQAMKIRPGEDILLVVLPMFHAFAATVGMLTPLAHGCAFVPVVKFDPSLVAQTIDRVKATIFLGVPSMYTVFLRLKPETVVLFHSLRFCLSGGAALPVEVLTQFESKFGIPVYEGDGPTECSPVTCLNPIGGLTKPGTVGLPIPNVEMKIVDDTGNQLAAGQVGEIAVRGPNVMRGYLHLPEETEAVMREGWFLTGDLGTEDEDGYFSIVDRKKDLVIVNGMNVYPRMIEEVLYGLQYIKEVAVVGQPHKTHGEIPVAYVALDDGADLSETDIRAWCLERLGKHQVPRKFYFMQSLPKNATGKILKRELSKRGEIERGVEL